jgi:hypothetical protein
MRKPRHIKLEVVGKGGRQKAQMKCHNCGKVRFAETDDPVELFQKFIREHKGCKTKKD